MWAWSLRPTRAKPTGRSASGSVASSRVKRPRCSSSTHSVPENFSRTSWRCAGRSSRASCQSQAVVDEALGQLQEEVALHGGEGAFDVEAVVEEAVEDGLADEVVVVGLGRDVQRPGAEGLAAAAAGLVLGVVDVEVGHLAVGQGADTTVEGALAAAALAAVGAGMGLGGAADDADSAARAWPVFLGGTEVRCRLPRTQALSFNPPSSYVTPDACRRCSMNTKCGY